MMDSVESTRVDRWLWSVRLVKTRPEAADACRGGHVRVNGRPAKPATTVSPGDEVRALVGQTTRVVEVMRVIQKRVGAADAATCFLDGGEDIARLSARGQGNQNIARFCECLHLTRENLLKTVVIANRSEQPSIGA